MSITFKDFNTSTKFNSKELKGLTQEAFSKDMPVFGGKSLNLGGLTEGDETLF